MERIFRKFDKIVCKNKSFVLVMSESSNWSTDILHISGVIVHDYKLERPLY